METELNTSLTETLEIAKDTGYLKCAKEVKDLINDLADQSELGFVDAKTISIFLDVRTKQLKQKHKL